MFSFAQELLWPAMRSTGHGLDCVPMLRCVLGTLNEITASTATQHFNELQGVRLIDTVACRGKHKPGLRLCLEDAGWPAAS
jgi:hypothetical protein